MNSGKKYYYIGEVADEVGLKEHVLRFWEKEFEFLRPVTNNANHRKYTRKDINLIKKIKYLVYDEKYTIPGARQKILELKKRNISIFDEFDPEIFNPMHVEKEIEKNDELENKSSIQSGEKLSMAIQNIAKSIDNSLSGEEPNHNTNAAEYTKQYVHEKQDFLKTHNPVESSYSYNKTEENAVPTTNPENVIPITKNELIDTLKDILNLLS